jgi:hypothetical protein
MSYFLIYFSVLGLAGLMPGLDKDRNAWVGFRFFLAAMSLPVLLFLGNVLAGLPLSVVGWGILIAGAAGFLYWGWELYRSSNLASIGSILGHPIAIFPILLLCVALWRGGIDYFPFPGDETASWLRYAKQIYVVDSYWSPELKYHLGGYSNGWPLLVAYSNIFGSNYDDTNGIILPFLLHVALLGFLFDFVGFLLSRAGIGGAKNITIYAWLFVLCLLMIQASWVLFPEFQLIDQPLLYAFLGAFLLGLAGLYDELDRTLIVFALGGVVAGGYLLKLSMLTIGPTLGVFWLGYLWREVRQTDEANPLRFLLSPVGTRKGVLYAAALLGPFFILSIIWSLHQFGSHCFSSPWAYVSGAESFVSETSVAVVQMIWNAMIAYVSTFKVELTLLSIIIFGVSFSVPRCRWFVAGLISFFSFYLVLTHSAYHVCIPPFGETGLQSFQRYFRPNLRLLHFFGPILFLIFLLEFEAFKSLLKRMGKIRVGRAVFILIIAGLLIYQGYSVAASLENTSTRQNLGAELQKTVFSIRKDAGRLIQFIQDRKLVRPRVSLIAQGGYGVEWDLSRYFGIGDKRGGSVFNYWPEPPHSWAPVRANSFTRITSAEELELWWKGFPIIWPIRTDPWTRTVLSALVDSEACRRNPEQFFLFNRGDGRFDCVPKGD